MGRKNNWDEMIDILVGFVTGNQMEEDHLATCNRLIEAEKFLTRIVPERMKEAKRQVKEYRKLNDVS